MRFLADCPDYVIQKMVTEVASIDAAEFATLDSSERQYIFRIMFNLGDTLRVPTLEMSFETLSKYLKLRWDALGQRCKDWKISSGLDMEWTHGAVVFEMDASKKPFHSDTLVPWLRNTLTKQRVPVPTRWGVTFGGVGTTWCIRDNWSTETARLENVIEKELFGLGKHFSGSEASVCMPKIENVLVYPS